MTPWDLFLHVAHTKLKSSTPQGECPTCGAIFYWKPHTHNQKYCGNKACYDTALQLQRKAAAEAKRAKKNPAPAANPFLLGQVPENSGVAGSPTKTRKRKESYEHTNFQ